MHLRMNNFKTKLLGFVGIALLFSFFFQNCAPGFETMKGSANQALENDNSNNGSNGTDIPTDLGGIVLSSAKFKSMSAGLLFSCLSDAAGKLIC